MQLLTRVSEAMDPEQLRIQLRERKRSRLATWLMGEGIEIGALSRPLSLPKSARALYVDRMPVADLRRHYPELADLPLVPVDIIGSAQDLSGIDDESVDFVIANHVFEHLEYPIRGLSEFLRVVRPGGIIYLALPDARAGIDQDRDLTPIEELLDEHRQGAEKNRRRHYEEWVFRSEKRAEDPELWVQKFLDMDYSIHFHVWNADSFLEFLDTMRRDIGLEFEIVAFAPPEYGGDDEFMVLLSKGRSRYPRLPPTAPMATPPSSKPLRQRVAESRVGPFLRPPYRAARRLLRAVRRQV